MQYQTADNVPADVVNRVLRRWYRAVKSSMDRHWRTLEQASTWMFMEAMQYLFDSVVVELGARKPSGVSFSFMNDIQAPCECEVLIVWTENPKDYIDPYVFREGCVATRVDEFEWPGEVDFMGDAAIRKWTVRRWLWQLSGIADDMPKEDA